jgi:hypothetical protein
MSHHFVKNLKVCNGVNQTNQARGMRENFINRRFDWVSFLRGE